MFSFSFILACNISFRNLFWPITIDIFTIGDTLPTSKLQFSSDRSICFLYKLHYIITESEYRKTDKQFDRAKTLVPTSE
jgi:hypothetical protein